jgi:hypothetical protein
MVCPAAVILVVDRDDPAVLGADDHVGMAFLIVIT